MALCFVLFRLEYVNRERLKDIEGKIVCANHISNWDPVFIGVAVPGTVRFMAKIELLKIPILKSVLYKLGVIPVNRGSNDLNAIKTAITVLKNNETLMLFPEGTRNPRGEVSPKAGVVNIAVRTDSKIIPVSISSPVRLFGKVRIVVGEEIYYPKEEYGKTGYEGCKEISENIMQYIKELSINENKHYRC
jgi:1-acyl-sn-glycerol-3-phosphate acyltransferase